MFQSLVPRLGIWGRLANPTLCRYTEKHLFVEIVPWILNANQPWFSIFRKRKKKWTRGLNPHFAAHVWRCLHSVVDFILIIHS